MTVFAPASENAPWIPWSERDGYLWTVAIMSTSSTLLVTSQFRLQVQCSSFSYHFSPLMASLYSPLSCLHFRLLLIFLVLCSSLPCCYSMLLFIAPLSFVISPPPFPATLFSIFLVFYIFWSNSKYMLGDKIMCTSSGPSRSSSCHPCA